MDEKTECEKIGRSHAYAWSGKVPCTGLWRCIYCGKPEDALTRDGKKAL